LNKKKTFKLKAKIQKQQQFAVRSWQDGGKSGRDQPLSFLPHIVIMRDFYQFCQVFILHIVAMKRIDK
jgi:hypothetical protein